MSSLINPKMHLRASTYYFTHVKYITYTNDRRIYLTYDTETVEFPIATLIHVTYLY